MFEVVVHGEIYLYPSPSLSSRRAITLSPMQQPEVYRYVGNANRFRMFTRTTRTQMHYDDAIMSEIASQITCLTIVYSTVHSGADQSKHQSSASLAFVWEIHRWPVNFPHRWPVTRKIFPFDDVIMDSNRCAYLFGYSLPALFFWLGIFGFWHRYQTCFDVYEYFFCRAVACKSDVFSSAANQKHLKYVVIVSKMLMLFIMWCSVPDSWHLASAMVKNDKKSCVLVIL